MPAPISNFKINVQPRNFNMTFNAGIPNASQSPGLFPAQNQTNMTRLKAIIGADHQFNDTTVPDTDGVHKQVTYINRATPGTLPANTNSILYAKEDANGASQLYFYNGATDTAITPIGSLKFTGNSGSLAPGGTFAIPGLPTNYTGTGYVWYDATKVFNYDNFFNVGGLVYINSLDSNTSNLDPAPPSLGFIGTALNVQNNNSFFNRVVYWSLTINEV